MKKTTARLLFCVLLLFTAAVSSAEEIMDSSEQKRGVVPYGDNEVLIHGHGIGMPLGRILLVHKDKQYCALKFKNFWTENNRTEKYAAYEAYQQQDGTGNMQNGNVKYSEGKASILTPRGPFRPFLKQPGYTKIDCGSLRLQWGYKGYVSFSEGYESKDQGIEMAPTPWTDISEVNVFDPHVKWYRYDQNLTKEIISPVNKLWK